MRFLAVLASGTRVNQMLGPPHPAASTNALSAVESSSTSEPNTAAQNLASASASAASNETDLMTEAMGATVAAPPGPPPRLYRRGRRPPGMPVTSAPRRGG